MVASAQTAKAAEIAAGTPAVDLHRAENVVAALQRVMRDLPGIGKDQTASAQQGGYSYRGIEQITRHVQPLFARHGVTFVPQVLSWEIRELVVNNKPWTDTVALISYRVYGPGGVEDSIQVGPILAIGRDNSDKGANKCMTQAFKYALLQALCVSDAKDDADGQTHEADAYETATAHHPLRLQVEALGEVEGQRVWAHFLATSQVAEADADRLLATDPKWREWLEKALAARQSDGDAER